MRYIIYSVSYDSFVTSHDKDGKMRSTKAPVVYTVGGAVALPGEVSTVTEIRCIDGVVFVDFENGMKLRVKEKDDTEYIYKPFEEADNGGDIQDRADQ